MSTRRVVISGSHFITAALGAFGYTDQTCATMQLKVLSDGPPEAPFNWRGLREGETLQIHGLQIGLQYFDPGYLLQLASGITVHIESYQMIAPIDPEKISPKEMVAAILKPNKSVDLMTIPLKKALEMRVGRWSRGPEGELRMTAWNAFPEKYQITHSDHIEIAVELEPPALKMFHDVERNAERGDNPGQYISVTVRVFGEITEE